MRMPGQEKTFADAKSRVETRERVLVDVQGHVSV
jgi:hypothetical protein